MKTITINHSINQVKTTLGWMDNFRDQYKADPDWVALARKIVHDAKAPTRESETEAIRRFVKMYVEYRLDPAGVEYLQDPFLLMDTRTGDCDDMACLAGVLLSCIGHEVYAVGVVWEGETQPTHATCLDQTSNLMCDPVADVPAWMWPQHPYILKRLVRK
jgi:hypothetical protein